MALLETLALEVVENGTKRKVEDAKRGGSQRKRRKLDSTTHSLPIIAKARVSVTVENSDGDDGDRDEKTREKEGNSSSKKKKWKKRNERFKLRPRFSLVVDDEDQLPIITMRDLQGVLLFSMMGMRGGYDMNNGWCKLLNWEKISKVAVLTLNGVSEKVYQANKESFTKLNSISGRWVNIIPAAQNIVEEILYVGMSKRENIKLLELKDKLYSDSDLVKDDSHLLMAADQSEASPDPQSKVSPHPQSKVSPDPHDRRTYLLTPKQLEKFRFPQEGDEAFVGTNHCQGPPSAHSPLFGLDCEMCMTKEGLELTKICLVDESGRALLQTLVKPDNPIHNYLTRYSGITAQLLAPVTTRLPDVQQQLVALLPPDAILVGHSLENDLRALRLYHPHVVDSSLIYTLRGGQKVSLKKLAALYLDLRIQEDCKGHNPLEDAQASLALVKLKLEKGARLRPFWQLERAAAAGRAASRVSFFSKIRQQHRDGAILDKLVHVKKFRPSCTHSHPCQTDGETVRKACHIFSSLRSVRFAWLQLHAYATLMEGVSQGSEVKHTFLENLDSRAYRVFAGLPAHSMLVMLMTPAPGTSVKEGELVRCLFAIKKSV